MFYSDFILFEDPTLDTQRKIYKKCRMPRRFIQLERHTTRHPTKRQSLLSKQILKSNTKIILQLLDKQIKPEHQTSRYNHRVIKGSSTQGNIYANQNIHYSRAEEQNERMSGNTTAMTDRRRSSQVILKSKSLALSTSRVYKNTRQSRLRIWGKYMQNGRRQHMDKDLHYLRLKDYFSGKYERTNEMNEIKPW